MDHATGLSQAHKCWGQRVKFTKMPDLFELFQEDEWIVDILQSRNVPSTVILEIGGRIAKLKKERDDWMQAAINNTGESPEEVQHKKPYIQLKAEETLLHMDEYNTKEKH